MGEFKVDDDWKRRAEEEKKKLQEKIDQEKKKEEEKPRLPPANFLTLISAYATQAMWALGDLAESPEEKKIDLDLARFAIDMLGVIEERTRGNLADFEKRALEEMLERLRLRFVEVSREVEGESSGP